MRNDCVSDGVLIDSNKHVSCPPMRELECKLSLDNAILFNSYIQTPLIESFRQNREVIQPPSGKNRKNAEKKKKKKRPIALPQRRNTRF